MRRKATSRQVGSFCPDTSTSADEMLAMCMVGLAEKKGRVVVWPTARVLQVPSRPGWTAGRLAVAQTAPKPGWRKPRRGEVSHG